MAFTRPQAYQVNTQKTAIDDPIIEINAALVGANTSDIGIIFNRGTSGNNVGILWDRTAGKMVFVETTADGSSDGDITFAGYADLHAKTISTDNFSFPAADGTNGQVLTTNGGGSVTFQTITPSQISGVGSANGLASLDAGAKIPTNQLPALALTNVYTVASESAQLALTAQEGDVAIRTDINETFVHNGGTSGTISDWSQLLFPTSTVTSVGGYTGAVSAAQLLTAIETVDGAASNLDADLLDGQQGSYYYSPGNPPPAASGIGVGQTWQNVLGSRTSNTLYTNTTGVPIQVMIIVSQFYDCTVYMDGTNGQLIYHDGNGGATPTISFIVPTGGSYKAVSTGFGGWWELR